MLRRISSFGALLVLAMVLGCGGGDTPAPTPVAAAPSGPPSAPPSAPPGPAAAAPVPAGPSDVFALIPESATGALSIRPQKLLDSPFGKADGVKKFLDEARNKSGVDPAQFDEVIVVFMGGGNSGGYNPASPYGGRPEGEHSPYGPGNPAYGPTPGVVSAPDGATAGQQAAMAAAGRMAESIVVIARSSAPLDQAKIIELAKVDAAETEVGEFKFHRAPEATGESICFFDDRTMVTGREAMLQTFLTPTMAATPYGPSPEGTAPAAVSSKLGDKLRAAPPELAIHGAMKAPAAPAPGSEGGMPAAAGMNPAAMVAAMAGGVTGGAFSVDLSSGAKLVIDVETANADEAQKLWVNLQSQLAMVGSLISMQRDAKPANATPEQLALHAKGFEAWDQFSKTMKVEKGGEGNTHVLVSGSLDQPLVDSLAAMMKRDLFVPPGSATAMAMVENQMKQIGTAAHTHLAEKGKLPTAAIMSADGKPLLSWRVALLPYLGQKELFDQFKLDEPWDSEHNKALVEKMPDVYSIPGVNEPGKTTFLAPISDKTVFGNKDGATLVMASDGASNTIYLVQANSDKAVTWTAPDDLKFDAAKPTAGIDKTYSGVFLALWLDGAVHAVALDTAKATTAGLFTYAGGESVDMAALIAAAATAATRTAEVAGAATDATAPGEKEYEEGWAGDAQRAIDQGHDKEAARLALAAALVADDEALAKDTMYFVKFGANPNKPVHFLRFGLGAMPDPKRRKETNATTGADYGRTPGSSSEEGEETDPLKQFDELAGEVGQEMIKELREMLDDGDFGKLFEYDRAKAGDGSGSSVESMRFEARNNPYGPTAPSADGSTQGTPDEVAEKAPRGLVILGSGDRKKLQDAASEAEVDLLLIAEITTKNPRSTDPAVQFSLTDVATKKRFAESDPIPLPGAGGSSAFGPAPAAGANNDEDDRKKNMAKWISTLKSSLKFKEIPKLPADKVAIQAKKNVGTGKQKHPLPMLLELRYYQAVGALKPEEALPLVEKVIGDADKAATLVNGTPEERKTLLEEFILPLPDEKGAKIDSDS